MRLIKLNLSDSLYNAVRKLAAKDHLSINQFISLAVAEKISLLMNEEYGARANRANKARFEAAMAKIADVEPEAQDRL